MRKKLGCFEFDSDFDSGNLDVVEPDDIVDDGASFVARTIPDCAGTSFENSNRTWFHFAIRGAKAGQKISIAITHLNKQQKLFSQGHAPVVRVQHKGAEPWSGKWFRGCSALEFETDDDDIFSIKFDFVFRPDTIETTATFFAFCIPFSYDELQRKLELCDSLFASSSAASSSETDTTTLSHSSPCGPTTILAAGNDENRIYFHRELLVHTLDGLRVDLLTISGSNGISDDEEPRLEGLFPDLKTRRSRQFPDKKVVFMSARVHPGETPASHVLNGFMDFILSHDDARAQQLRKLYVFKLIPMLNPDGVKRGHYRTDSRGINLNRFYLNPSINYHPSIFAAREVILYHHRRGTLQFYIDQHAHAAKRGCFVYGNALELSRQIDNVAYAKLVALNSSHFDFKGSCFSEGNMFASSKRDNGLSKEGSGRVGIFLATNLTHVYTVECNYNTGKTLNILPPCSGDSGMSEQSMTVSSKPPPYTKQIYEDVGRAFALAMLDMVERNPWSRVPNSEFGCLSALKKHIGECIRNSRMKQGKPPSAMPRRVAVALRQQQAVRRHSSERPLNTGGGTSKNKSVSDDSVSRPSSVQSPLRKKGTCRNAKLYRGEEKLSHPSMLGERTLGGKTRQPQCDNSPVKSLKAKDDLPESRVPRASTVRRTANRTAISLSRSTIDSVRIGNISARSGGNAVQQLRAQSIGTKLTISFDAPVARETISRIPRPNSARKNTMASYRSRAGPWTPVPTK